MLNKTTSKIEFDVVFANSLCCSSSLDSKRLGSQDSGYSYTPGVTVTLDRVDRHHAGVYQCTAKNGVGPPATVDVRLDILRKLKKKIQCMVSLHFV